jgi:RNA polymerase sigma factor (sigma-70 family)
MGRSEFPDALRDDLRTAWHRYVDELVSLRPALYGYCRRLAGNVWDAEDLVQDTLLRAFAHWGVTYPPIRDPRPYLLRTATNVWIDTLRHRQTEARASSADLDRAPATGASPETSSDVRDAGSRLLQRLSPQERAAIVLKEVFVDERSVRLLDTRVSSALEGRAGTDEEFTQARTPPHPVGGRRMAAAWDERSRRSRHCHPSVHSDLSRAPAGGSATSFADFRRPSRPGGEHHGQDHGGRP